MDYCYRVPQDKMDPKGSYAFGSHLVQFVHCHWDVHFICFVFVVSDESIVTLHPVRPERVLVVTKGDREDLEEVERLLVIVDTHDLLGHDANHQIDHYDGYCDHTQNVH